MFGLRLDPQKAGGNSERSARRKPARVLIALFFAPVLMLFSSGCAQKQSPSVATMKPHNLAAQAGTRVAGVAYADVDLEDDGREAQQPPLIARKPLADDPTEPFSPNYGRTSSWQSEPSDYNTTAVFTPRVTSEPVRYQHSIYR